jgi:hypothetical protein
VASLLVARAAAREREMAVRVSIGPGRERLLQQLLVESGMLAVVATATGMLFGRLLAPAIVACLSRLDDPIALDLHFDLRALTFALAVCVATTILCGLIPALRASTVGPIDALKRTSARGIGHLGVLKTLVAAQVGFIFVVLFVSALFLTSFNRLTGTDPGFTSVGIVLMALEAPDLQDEKALARARAVAAQLLDAVSRQSGVESASLSGWPLFRGWSWDADIRIPGRRAPVDAALLPRGVADSRSPRELRHRSRSSSSRSSSRHSAFTFTCRSRYTRASKNRSSSSRAAVPIRLIISPARPTTMAFCEARSTRIEQYSRMIPLASGSSNRSTTTAVENGSSACVCRSTCSRTSSATKNRSG